MVAVCACFVLACRPQGKSPDLTFAHEISPQPPRVGKVTIELNIKDSSGAPVSGARLNLEGNMSHAGMVPVFVAMRETAPGRYQSSMELSMAGDWNVTIPDRGRGDPPIRGRGQMAGSGRPNRRPDPDGGRRVWVVTGPLSDLRARQA